MKKKWAYRLAAFLIWPLCLGCATGAARLPGLAGEMGLREGLGKANQAVAGGTDRSPFGVRRTVNRLDRSEVIRGQTPTPGTRVPGGAFRQTASAQWPSPTFRQAAAHRLAILRSHRDHGPAGCSTCGGGGCPHCSGSHESGWSPTHYVWFDYVEPKNLVYPPANQPAAVVHYPYYTVKGPTDFFME